MHIQRMKCRPELIRFHSTFSLYDVEILSIRAYRGDQVNERALICLEQCYVLRQINDQLSDVIHRFAYKYLKNIRLNLAMEKGFYVVGESILQRGERLFF